MGILLKTAIEDDADTEETEEVERTEVLNDLAEWLNQPALSSALLWVPAM